MWTGFREAASSNTGHEQRSTSQDRVMKINIENGVEGINGQIGHSKTIDT